MQMRQTCINEVISIVISRVSVVIVPFLPSPVSSPGTVEILRYVVVGAVVDIQMCNAPANILNLVELRVATISRKA